VRKVGCCLSWHRTLTLPWYKTHAVAMLQQTWEVVVCAQQVALVGRWPLHVLFRFCHSHL
jgi:hypothetical protein